MKGDQMGSRAAYPTPPELPLSNRTWFKCILPFQSLNGASRRAGKDQVVGPLRHRIQRRGSGRAKAAQLDSDTEEIPVSLLPHWNIQRQIVGVPGITQQAPINLDRRECWRNGR